MCFEELIKLGAKVLIRGGTCGSLQPTLTEGNLIVVTGAVRRDGVTDMLVPPSFPAVSDVRIVSKLEKTALESGIPYEVGLCVSEGVFYDGPLGNQNELWAKIGVKAIEMEVSTLFVIASLRGVRAGAILAVDNYVFDRAENNEDYNPHKEIVLEGTRKMCRLLLDTIVQLED